jgi:hypothetical protein
MTSPDGTTWTSRTTPTTGFWSSVTYGNGLFVAVRNVTTGTTSDVMTSPDGITWTLRTTPNTGSWQNVTYGYNMFFAMSSSSTANASMVSYDGVNWSSLNTPSNGSWNGITYANGMYVAVRGPTTGTTSDAMTMTPIINWGGLPANNYGSVVSSGGNDPTQGASTILAENYTTFNDTFTNPNDVAVGQYGEWDFDLDLSHATYENTYCFQVVNSDGSALNTYSTYPQITRCTEPPLDRRLRTGTAFCNGVKEHMWEWAGE